MSTLSRTEWWKFGKSTPDLTPSELTLDGDVPYKNPHAKDFRPPTAVQNLRQEILGILAKRPEEAIPLSDFTELTLQSYRKVYQAAKFLCMRSMALRIDQEKFRVKRNGEKVPNGYTLCVKYVAPFSRKICPEEKFGKVTLW